MVDTHATDVPIAFRAVLLPSYDLVRAFHLSLGLGDIVTFLCL